MGVAVVMLSGQRGQTLPFWALSVLAILATTFFLASYANTIAWQIHAQNAADSAANVGLSPTLNVANQESVLLYASAVNEYRLRYLNQGMLNAINKIGCTTTGKPSCATIYAALGAEYGQALSAYNNLYQVLQQANNYTQGGQQADEKKAISALGNFDPAFTYTELSATTGNNGNGKGKNKNSIRKIDIVACRNVPYFAPTLMGLASGASFQALGRASAQAVPVVPTASPPAGAPTGYSEYFSPGSTNPATGKAYQANEDPASTGGNILFMVPFATSTGASANLYLTVDLDWFQAATIKPFFQGGGTGGSLGAGDYGCTNG